MAARDDSPIISTFAHARKLSASTGTLSCIEEQPRTQTTQQQQILIFTPSAHCQMAPKWDRYNAAFGSPMTASQRIYHNLQDSSAMPMEKFPSVLSLPLLGAESNHVSESEDWDQGWDIAHVQEMPWDDCRLPLITGCGFNYYPEQSAHILSTWSTSSKEGEDKLAKTVESIHFTEDKRVERKYEKKRFARWFKMMLGKLKRRKSRGT